MLMRYSSRLVLYAPFAALLVLAVVAGLRWWSVADALEKQLGEANRGHEIAPGVNLRFDKESIAGFPFNIDAVLEDVTLSVGAPRRPMVWHTEHFAIHALTYGRFHEIYEAAGKQSLSWTDANGDAHRFEFVPGSLRASAVAADGRLAHFDLDIGALGSSDLSAARAQLHLRENPAHDVLDVFISVDLLHVSPALHSILGSGVDHLTVAGRLTHAAELLPLLSGKEAWEAATESWRRSAGAFELDALDITSDKLRAKANGKLSLDGLHRVQGALDLRIANHALIQDDVSNRFAAALVKLTKDGSSDAAEARDITIGLQDGQARVRTLKGPWQWGGVFDPVY